MNDEEKGDNYRSHADWKIQKAIDHINHFLAEREKQNGSVPILHSDITNIKSILETGKLPDYN